VIEICHNVAPVPQPSPARNPGGDCFACALTAGLRWIYQKPDIAFDLCWDFFKTDRGGLQNAWPGMRAALYAADSHFRDADAGRLEILADLVLPTFEPETWSHAWFAGVGSDYALRLEGYLRGGFIAFTEIDFAGRGPYIDGYWNTTDHFVLIDGIRRLWRKHPTMRAWSDDADVHVVCSAKGAYWIPLKDWLTKHGAAGWWLARKDLRDHE